MLYIGSGHSEALMDLPPSVLENGSLIPTKGQWVPASWSILPWELFASWNSSVAQEFPSTGGFVIGNISFFSNTVRFTTFYIEMIIKHIPIQGPYPTSYSARTTSIGLTISIECYFPHWCPPGFSSAGFFSSEVDILQWHCEAMWLKLCGPGG